MERLAIAMVCRAYGVAVAIGHMSILSMLGCHSPGTLVATMIHRWWLRLDLGADAGPVTLRLWHSSRLWSWGCPIGRDVVL
jgi:hypothetical protein